MASPKERLTFTAKVWLEGQMCIAQACEVDVASQGFTVSDALGNLKEAMELRLESKSLAAPPVHAETHQVEITVDP